MDRQKEIYNRFAQEAKKHGVKIFRRRVREPTAGQLRKRCIEFYETYNPQQYVQCISCCRKELEQLERDRQYNLRAYHIMSDEEVLMSERREREYSSRETQKFIDNLREFGRRSRNVRIVVK